MPTNILQFNNVSYSKGETGLLSNISFAIKENSIHALLGPNGAGKSTILKLSTSLLEPTVGTIRFFNENLTSNLACIGSMIDSASLYEHLSVFENLYIAALQRKIPKTKIPDTLEIVGLEEEHRKKAKNLSMGMRQRLGIAMAIIHTPKLLLLDEPANGLDPEGVIGIRRLLMTLKKELGVAVFFSSHILNEVDKIAQEITFIKHGRILFSGNLQEFKSDNNLETGYLNRLDI